MAIQNYSQKRSASRQVRSSDKGSILIIALWSLFLLTSFSVYLGEGVRQKLILVKRLEERDKLHYIAEAGIKKVISEAMMTVGDGEGFVRGWDGSGSAFQDISLGDGNFSIISRSVDEITGEAKVRYVPTDEESKINLNTADEQVLRRFFRVVLGSDEIEAQELAASVVDWRDADSELSIPLGSAEDSYYRSLRYAYEAKDADFEVLDEVLLVKGISQEVFDKIRDLVTIYGEGRVNVNTASKYVLSSVGLNAYVVTELLKFRRGEDNLLYTDDDNVFYSASEIVPKLSQFTNLSSGDIANLDSVSDMYLTAKSSHFMVKSIAKLRNRSIEHHTRAVIDTNGNILYWQEH